jgi:hypothetical protein
MGERDKVWEHGNNLFPGFKQVLFQRILSGWSYKVEGAFDGERWKYFPV